MQVEDITKVYFPNDPKRKLKALDRISFSASLASLIVIVGSSGCGKTSLLNLISGLDHEFAGEISFAGETVPKIGYLFQTPSLIPWRTVWQNIVIGPELEKAPETSYVPQALQLLKKYDLDGFASGYPHHLSLGMQQRVALIRLLLFGADVLLLDEAFSRIDPIVRSMLYQDVDSLVEREKKTVVMVTHDIEEAVMLADKVIVLSPRPGRVVAEISISSSRAQRLLEPIGKSDLLIPYFREVWNALDEAKLAV